MMGCCPFLLSAQTKPLYYKEIEQNAFALYNLPQIDAFSEWLASPLVQNSCIILIAISFLYCATTLLLYVLIIRQAIPSKQWMKNWLVIEIPSPLIKKPVFAKPLIKKFTDNQTEIFQIDRQKEQLINSLLP